MQKIKYPWKRYSEFSIIPDFTDQHGRVYVRASEEVRQVYAMDGCIVLEMKIPIRRGVVSHAARNFPEIGERMQLTVHGEEPRPPVPVEVAGIYFAPRGATGVCVVKTI